MWGSKVLVLGYILFERPLSVKGFPLVKPKATSPQADSWNNGTKPYQAPKILLSPNTLQLEPFKNHHKPDTSRTRSSALPSFSHVVSDKAGVSPTLAAMAAEDLPCGNPMMAPIVLRFISIVLYDGDLYQYYVHMNRYYTYRYIYIASLNPKPIIYIYMSG